MTGMTHLARRSFLPSANVPEKRRYTHRFVAYFAALLDFVVVLACSIVGVVGYHYSAFGLLIDPAMNMGLGLVAAVVFVLAMGSMHAYGYKELSATRHQTLLIVFLVPTVLAFLLAVVFLLKLGETFSRGAVLNLAGLSILSLIMVRLWWRHSLSRSRSRSWLRPKRVFFICPDNMPAETLDRFTQSGEMRICQIGTFPETEAPAKHLRERLMSIGDIDEIVIVWKDAPTALLEQMLNDMRRLPLPVKVVFDSFTGSVVSCQAESIGSIVAFQVQSPPLTVVERAAKRGFDIVFSVLALAALAPTFIIVAIAIKCDSAGPVLFWQRRRGHGNRLFRIAKFRSMSVMEDHGEVKQATKADPRITRVGRFIRRSSIDELPQFWNVLKGEMSVVGPRPHAVAHDDVYDQLIEQYANRRHVKPGLTGWAQVKGYRGETPTVETMQQRVHHDLWYIDNWSLWLDAKIVMRTIFALKGA